MNIDLMRSAEQLHKRHRRNRMFRRLVSILGCLVVFWTTYAMILPAITLERETVCGLAEHQHEESCHTLQTVRHLTCAAQSIGVHTHTAQCADGSCGYADFVLHTHDASCRDASGVPVCVLPEVAAHTHSDGCYRIPTWEEPGHTHTEQCYGPARGALICGREETEGHTHTDSCKGQVPVLCCDLPETDGHTHAEGCYNENRELTCTLAETKGHHHAAACYRTEEKLTCGKEACEPHHHTDACYEWVNALVCGEKEGPILRQGTPELICGRQQRQPHRHTAACFAADGAWICGQPEILSHTHTDACFTCAEEDVLTCGLEEHTHGEACYAEESATEEAVLYSVMSPDAESPGELPVKSLSGNETTYDPAKDLFTTGVCVDFTFDTKPTAGTVYTYSYPAGIVVPDDIVNQGAIPLYDGDIKSGTYQYIKNSDGTYCVQVIFDEAYIQQSGGKVKGYIQFSGSFHKTALNENGDIVVGGDKKTVLVPHDQIAYPKDETESYDLSVSKSGSWVEDGDKLVYTVYVRTTKGTPTPICFTDTMSNLDGLTLSAPEVTAEKYVRHWYSEYSWVDETQGTPVNILNCSAEGNTLTMSLDGLSSSQAGDRIDQEFYKITYTYTITGQTVECVSPNNTVTVSATDSVKHQTVSDTAGSQVNVTKDFSYTVAKNGAVASDKPGYIRWTVTVNNNRQNLAGAVLTDQMLGLIQDTAGDITISPSQGATVSTSDGKITGITFTETENNVNKNQYTITYDTPVEESWDGKTVTNEAILDPKPAETGDEKKATATVTVSGVRLDKSGAHNPVTNQIDWTISVNSGNLDIAGATLTDEMFAALSDTDFSIRPASGYQFTMDAGGKITGITFTAGENGKNTQSYTITYSTAAPTGQSESSVTNRAILSPGSTRPGTPIQKEATVTLGKPGLSKGGSYDGGVITWTVTVNDNGKDIAGAVLTDSMFGRLTSSDITVKDASWQVISGDSGVYTIHTAADGKVTGITFNAIGGTGVNTNKYVLTYQTDAPPTWDAQNIHNASKLTLDGKETDAPADVTIPASGRVSKSAGPGAVSEDGATLTIPWTVTLNIPEGGISAGSVMEDDVTRNQWGGTNTNQWMTTEQVNALKNATATWWDDNDAKKGSHPFADDTVTPTGSENVYTGFTITLGSALTPPAGATKLTFTYYTTSSLGNMATGQNKLYNCVDVGGKEASAEYTYHKAGVVKTDGSGNVNTTQVSNEGELTWRVDAVVGEGNKKLTLIDTLPEGVTLNSLTLTGWNNLNVALSVNEDTISGTDSTNQYTVGGTYRGRVITLDIVPLTDGNDIPAGAAFTLTVNCTVTDAAAQTGTKTLTNTAEMKLDDRSIGSASQTQEWTYQIVEDVTRKVSKQGSWDNTNRFMNYSVVLNQESADLVEGADTLTLTDTMTYKNQVWLSWPFDGSIAYSLDASLVPSSVNLSYAVQNANGDWIAGESVTGWDWTYSAATGKNDWDKMNATNTITVTGVPDGAPLLLSYSYRVTTSVPDEINGQKTYFNLSFSNEVKLEGTAYSQQHATSETKWEFAENSAGVTTEKSYVFYKVEEGKYNHPLSGTVFSVYSYDTKAGNYAQEPVRTYTTDDDTGAFRITRQIKDDSDNVTFTYAFNTLYKVVETQPPEGYLLPTKAETYYFYFSSPEDTAHTLPSSLPDGAVDLTNATKTVYVENPRNATEITVNKVWEDKDGNNVTESHTSGSVTISLYRKTTASGGGTGGSEGSAIPYTVTYNDGTVSGIISGAQAGSKVKVSVTVFWNSEFYKPPITITGITDGSGTWIDGTPGVYTYVGTASGEIAVNVEDRTANGTNITTSCELLSTPSVPVDNSGGTTTAEGTQVDSVTLDISDRWSHTFENLPLKGTDAEGNPVNYYYYVVEESVAGYDTAYANNGGIQSGTITVTNKATTDTPQYTLPETGGAGTGGYTLGGFTLTLGAALWLLCRRKRGREDF